MFHRSQRQKKQRTDISHVFFRRLHLQPEDTLIFILLLWDRSDSFASWTKRSNPRKRSGRLPLRLGQGNEENTCTGPVDKQNREEARLLPLPRSQPASSPAAWPPPWLCAGPSACRTRPTRTAGSPRRRRPATSGQENIEMLPEIPTGLKCACGESR